MLPPLLDRTSHSPADKWLWALIGVLVIGQLFAFWMLCRQQVRQAEARHASAQLERMAMLDCIQTIPGATRSHCATRVTLRPAVNDANAVMQALR
jgi:hypothetical protein